MATKKKSKSSAKKAAKKAAKKTAKKSSKKTAKKTAKKTVKKTSKKTARKAPAKSTSLAASSAFAEEEFAAPAPAYTEANTSYESPASNDEGEGKGAAIRLAVLGGLLAILAVLIVIKLTGGSTTNVDSNPDIAGDAATAVETPVSAEEDEAPADVVPEAENVPAGGGDAKSYTVKAGDTLWGVAASQMGDGNKWKAIYEANALKSRSLSAGQVLTIPAQ